MFLDFALAVLLSPAPSPRSPLATVRRRGLVVKSCPSCSLRAALSPVSSLTTASERWEVEGGREEGRGGAVCRLRRSTHRVSCNAARRAPPNKKGASLNKKGVAAQKMLPTTRVDVSPHDNCKNFRTMVRNVQKMLVLRTCQKDKLLGKLQFATRVLLFSTSPSVFLCLSLFLFVATWTVILLGASWRDKCTEGCEHMKYQSKSTSGLPNASGSQLCVLNVSQPNRRSL